MSLIFKKELCPLNDVQQYNTRGVRYNSLVPHRRSVDSSTFYYARIIDWNSLPEWLKELEKPHRFNIALKKFLIEHHHETELEEILYY